MADPRPVLVARLGAVATGRGDLARPRRRSRFEDSAPSGLVEVHDELVATRPSWRPAPQPATTEPAISAPAPSGQPPATPDERPVGEAPHRTASTPVSRPVPEPVDPLRSAAAAAGEPMAAGAPPVIASVAAPTGTPSPSAAPTTPAVLAEHHHHVEHVEHVEHVARHEHVEHHEHRHDAAVTQLFQWIDAAADPRVATDGPPVASREQPEGPRRTDRHDGRRGSPPPATVVSIGRVEIRTVRPVPPARHRPPGPATLDFAGPTLEEFLGGRR